MANGHPKFGGTNGAPALDIGQPGGTRYGAGTAFSTIRTRHNPPEVASQLHHLAQQNANVRDVSGFVRQRVQWSATLRTNTIATWDTIAAELNGYKSGSVWVAGVPGVLDPNLLRETQLTDGDGTVIATKAVLADWRQLTDRQRNSEWGAIARVQIEFEIIG